MSSESLNPKSTMSNCVCGWSVITHKHTQSTLIGQPEAWRMVLPHHPSALCFTAEKYSKDCFIVYSSQRKPKIAKWLMELILCSNRPKNIIGLCEKELYLCLNHLLEFFLRKMSNTRKNSVLRGCEQPLELGATTWYGSLKKKKNPFCLSRLCVSL